ncbi:MAG: hypothetical protein PHW04_17190 [Candidatus Wallbacteria bacterium]|nr:hypothetical protein [Candidatus Wallbacteria bacterium]
MKEIESILHSLSEAEERVKVPEIDVTDLVLQTLDELEWSENYSYNWFAIVLSILVTIELWICGPLFYTVVDPLGAFFRIYAFAYPL